jgi:hypothetical protein
MKEICFILLIIITFHQIIKMLNIEIFCDYKFSYREKFCSVFSTITYKTIKLVESILSIKSFYIKIFYYDCLNLRSSNFSTETKYY